MNLQIKLGKRETYHKKCDPMFADYRHKFQNIQALFQMVHTGPSVEQPAKAVDLISKIEKDGLVCPTGVMVKVHKALNVEDIRRGQGEKVVQQLDVRHGFLDGRLDGEIVLEINRDIVELGLSNVADTIATMKKQIRQAIVKLQKLSLAFASEFILREEPVNELGILGRAIEVHGGEGCLPEQSAHDQQKYIDLVDNFVKEGSTAVETCKVKLCTSLSLFYKLLGSPTLDVK